MCCAVSIPDFILIAEDSATIRLMLVKKLSEAGWRVVDAPNGEVALAAARKARPRLVLTDLQMPRLDGLALARALRCDPTTCDVPVLLLSARGHRVSADDLANTNIQHVLMKPFSIREIISVIEEYFSGDEAGDRLAA